MNERDLDEADALVRRAFGTKFGLADPSQAFGDAEIVRPRFRAQPEGALVAEDGARLVGVSLVTRWGGHYVLGPVAVDPAAWDRGVGRQLVAASMDYVDRMGARVSSLFTFPDSPKHLALYQGAGFWPGHLTALTRREPRAREDRTVHLDADRLDGALLEGARQLAHRVLPELDLTAEIASLLDQGLGEALVLVGADGVEGLALVHLGAGEAGSASAYVKVAVASPEAGSSALAALLDGAEAAALARGLDSISCGVNTSRRGAYRLLLERGHRVEGLGVTMVRPDPALVEDPRSWVLDDLR